MMPAEPSTYRDWPKTGEGFGPLEFGPFGRAELALYAAASGDDNPLHLDDAIATAAGLEASPVQGMLMASCLEPAVSRWRGDLAVTSLAVKFLRPVLAGETLDVSGRVVRAATTAAPELVLRLTVRNRAREIAVLAEATATVAPTPAEG